jgi:hypothetical protein
LFPWSSPFLTAPSIAVSTPQTNLKSANYFLIQFAHSLLKINTLFFNTLKFFSFFLNEKFLKDTKVLVFFEDAVKAFYDQVVLKHIPTEKQRDAKTYPEFKKLYARPKEKTI